uniref:Uncharacterized protein n=1 Tax=Oryza punctata TaxID=4537 RepID=A0A0E0JXX9_ORYPU
MDKMMRSQGGGGGVAGEYQYYYRGGGLVDQEMAVAALPSSDDGVVLLMELLDDEEEMEDDYSSSPAATTGGVRVGDGDADRLSRVIRSLEAEIGGGATGTVAPPPMDSDESLGAAGPASDDDGAVAGIRRLEDMFSDDLDGYGGGAFGYGGWPPELALPTAAHEAAGWSLYGDENLYYGDGSLDEQVYSPLWEQ